MVFSEIYEYWDAPTKRQFATVRQEMRNSGTASLPAIRESLGQRPTRLLDRQNKLRDGG